MILTIILHFVTMATTYLSNINNTRLSVFSEKVGPLIYIGTAYISSSKFVEITSKFKVI